MSALFVPVFGCQGDRAVFYLPLFLVGKCSGGLGGGSSGTLFVILAWLASGERVAGECCIGQGQCEAQGTEVAAQQAWDGGEHNHWWLMMEQRRLPTLTGDVGRPSVWTSLPSQDVILQRVPF